MSIRHPVPVTCACGCGGMTKGQSKSGYITGHQNRGARHKSRSPGFPDGVLIDEADRIRFGMHSWSLSGNGYVQRHHVISVRKYTKIRLHQEIMGFPDGIVDHVNGDRLDYRRSNLRVVTDQGNAQNQCLSSRNTSGYRGVSWNKASEKWYAHAKMSGRMISLGLFDDLHEAGKVAREYREQHYKSFVNR